MKKILLLLLLLLPIISFTGANDVYICKSKGAKKYHLIKDCRGLSNCKTEISKVTLKEAQGQGKDLCGFEK
ncbi:hypothetical protein Q765_15925 [Flavobacterium rivuli WB 3.3-2 = DSM 21788]|uniref:DUF4124 domain-containing protein n=1 Tax=Flavobacterium rivuli WB 3.3-2 = DSM 21788 TaxID=1121895 RepID=A0A0A2LZP5_9FLAO|nr:hypothetical protein [Flavobacterium rivuli]KGO85509.1 hypothetical protein Q765_15925 [Flavobacterium rivuli WB 3.3-2 = DSM 21788]